MYQCPNCNKTVEAYSAFCPDCGSAMQAVEAQPVYEAATPPVSKAKSIVGMALSAQGLLLAIPATFFAIFSCYPVFAVMLFMISLIGAPCSIVGYIMSKKNLEAGDTTIFSKLGNGFGKGGTIAYCVFAGLLALVLTVIIAIVIIYIIYTVLVVGLLGAASSSYYY